MGYYFKKILEKSIFSQFIRKKLKRNFLFWTQSNDALMYIFYMEQVSFFFKSRKKNEQTKILLNLSKI